MSYTKPVPTVDDNNRPFWEGVRDGRLIMQRCTDCGHLRYPCAPSCPECLSPNAAWEQLSGRGEVFSFVIFHQVYHAAFKEDVPYNVILVQLEEGPRMFSNLVECELNKIEVGMPVALVCDPVTPELTIPRFRPARVQADG